MLVLSLNLTTTRNSASSPHLPPLRAPHLGRIRTFQTVSSGNFRGHQIPIRIKLAELDETVSVAEAEIEKLRHYEERIQAMEKDGEELLERYSKLVPEELDNLLSTYRRQIYHMLQIEVLVPKEGEIKIRLPFLPEEGEFCREETAHVTVYNTGSGAISRSTKLGISLYRLYYGSCWSGPAPRQPWYQQAYS